MEIQLDFEPNGVVAMFDQHDVIDTMNFEEACHTGVSLDFNDSVTTLLCSYGKDHRREAFEPRAEWLPMVKECEGCIFTDYREGFHRTVDIYRESWMSPDCMKPATAVTARSNGFEGRPEQVKQLWPPRI